MSLLAPIGHGFLEEDNGSAGLYVTEAGAVVLRTTVGGPLNLVGLPANWTLGADGQLSIATIGDVNTDPDSQVPAEFTATDTDSGLGVDVKVDNSQSGLIVEGIGGQAAIFVKTDQSLARGSLTTNEASVLSDTGSVTRTNLDGSRVISLTSLGIYMSTHEGVSVPDFTSDWNNGDLVMWFDQTPGSAKLSIIAKDSGGTVVTGSVALTP